MYKFALFGKPTTNSITPQIMQEFAKQHELKLEFAKVDCEPNELADKINQLIAAGGRGFNITTPLKEAAYTMLHQTTDRAKHAQAINTVVINEDKSLLGDNTDGIGFTRDLVANNHFHVRDSKVLILGAGGAARGIMRPLLSLTPQKIVIANRDLDKARRLEEYFKPWGKVRTSSYEQLSKQKFDLIINATSAGHQKILPPLPENFSYIGSTVYDLNYGAASQPLRQLMNSKAVNNFIDGYGMLVEQAAEAFKLWFNLVPETEPLLAQRLPA